MLSIHRTSLGITLILMVCAKGTAAPASPAIAPFRTVWLKDTRSISDAMAVNSAIDVLMGHAGSCHARGLEAALSCACNATADLSRLKAVYRQTALRHPDWNEPNTIVTYKNSANGHFISLNFAATDGMIARCDKH
jgi:hypothetical protein